MANLNKDEVLNLFYKSGFFKAFTPEEKFQLADQDSQLLTYYPKDYIIEEGDVDNSLYLLLKGKAYVCQNIRPRSKIAELNPGAVFGEISLLSEHPRTTNIVADTEVLVLKIDPDFLKRVGPELECKVKDQLIKVLVLKLNRMNQSILDLKRRIPEDDWPI